MDTLGAPETLEPITLSALQHWAYCPRQCGLIHLEQAFDENVYTLRGQAVHATVDKPGVEERKGLRVERALPLWSDALGLTGKALPGGIQTRHAQQGCRHRGL
jgi:CRISPR-associated exonuclease Cas4